MDPGREWARTVGCIDERSSLRVVLVVHESTDRLLAVLVHAHLDGFCMAFGSWRTPMRIFQLARALQRSPPTKK